MVFPLALVVLGAISPHERTSFYFLTAVYLLWRLDWLFSLADLSFRIFLLVVACVGILVVLWAVRADRMAARVGVRPFPLTRMKLLCLAAAILLVSLIVNILGGVRLAALLAGACIASAYGAVAIYAGALVLESFILPLFQSPVAQMSVALREQGQELRRRASILIRFTALIAWVLSTLMLFRIARPILDWLTAVVSRPWSFGRVTFSLGGILLFIATIWVSVLAARVAAFVAEKDILSRMKLPQGIPSTISTLILDVVIVAGFVLALAGAGVQWGQVVLIASAIGVGIGLGLQQLVASFIAGVILMVERQVRVGDVVVLEGVEGTVTRIGLRSSTLRVVDGSELICPNSRLISAELTNWTLSDQLRRVEIQVGAALGTDPDRVLALLKRAVCGHPGVLQRPAPDILFKAFGESWLIFVVRFFTLHNGWVAVSSEVTARVNAALQDAGIEIATPRRDIRIASRPEEAQPEALEGTTSDVRTVP
jgi:small-conductance mechanosensitive channel